MALELVGGAFLSASLQALFDRLFSPEVWSFIGGQKVSEELLLELREKLLVVDKMLDHAEVKQFTDERVKKWLVCVKNAVYDAENLLDEIATEALRRKMEAADSRTGLTDALNSFSTWLKAPLADVQSVESRAEKIIRTLEVLVAQARDVLALKGDGKKLPQRLPSTSLVDEFSVYGRDEIKEDMIKRLLSDNTSRNKIDVISIVGMGGAGKTTLAQLLYNDGRVKGHFHLKAWVCVSNEFCLLKVTKSILAKIGSATSSDRQSEDLDSLQQELKKSLVATSSDRQSEDLDSLQQELKKRLGDKTFLLVLDDVWEKCPSEGEGSQILLRDAWQALRIPLLAAGEGSKVVVTTRNLNVATIMRADHTHHLEGLSQEHCWSLFENLAFENGASGPYPHLESIGRKIVAKCQGLPLAVRALGCLLYPGTDRRKWEEILESEIWDLQDSQGHKILPSLILSYQDLPLHLKRCFAYCSIFPKDHEFDKENLILLWMAEGLLPFSKRNERMGKVGEQYFDELVWKSFFQSVKEESYFVMHDLIHDLAQYTSREFCIRVEDDKVPAISENTHHSLVFCRNSDRLDAFKRFEALAKMKCLRTYLELPLFPSYRLGKRGMVDLHAALSKWRYLRVLSLSIYFLTDLPDSIGELKHLRYLGISKARIEKLPDSVCCLYNLQTMIVSDRLIELPKRMDKLINLRYLDIRACKEMASHISQLKNLQKLSNFIVGQKGGLRIGELGELSKIGGRLEISEMQNVECARDALGANMKDKTHLDELALKWSHVHTNNVIQRGVLNNLQPYPNLKQLTIKGYPGVAFPDWIGGRSSLENLVTLELERCENCSSLPPLGQLPLLKHLSISGLKGVKSVGGEFYGVTSSSIASKPSFPFLQTLRFERMDNWETWLCCGCEFHRLQELYIKECPKLTEKLPEELPSLTKLEIDGCWRLVASLQVPAIRELKMVGFGELQLKSPASGFTALQTSHIEISNVRQWRQLPLEPHELTIRNLDAVESLLEEGILQTRTSAMQDLKILGCYFSRPLNRFGFPMVTLKSLQIWNCDNVGFLLPELFRCHHPSLEELNIRWSKTDLSLSSSISLSFSLAIFPRLIHFYIDSVDGLESLFISISEGEPTSLRSLEIIQCHDLKSLALALALSSLQRLTLAGCSQLLFHNIGLPSDLRELEIFNCNQLKPQADWGLQRLASLTKFQIGGGCQDVESFPEELLLPSTLTTLEIVDFPLKSLDGRGLQQLTSLTKLSIRDCPQLQFNLQEGFQLPSLMELEIEYCPGLQSFGEDILRHLSSLERLSIKDCYALQTLTGSGLQHLTSLEKLDISYCPKLQSLKEAGLPCLASLKELYILDLPELQSLTEVGLQHLTSLEALFISRCPKLQSLTRERLPDSLSSLCIEDCPLLEQWCQFEKGQEWDYIAHIPQIDICGEAF